MRSIPLTKGFVAIVDDEDFERVSTKIWLACVKPSTANGVIVYAVSATKKDDGTKTLIKMHQFILNCVGVDHRNGNGLDNRRSNLRPCNNQQNQRNRRKLKATKSKYKGVWPKENSNRWGARIVVNKHIHYLGTYDTEYDAAVAYNIGAQLFFGEFACLNPV